MKGAVPLQSERGCAKEVASCKPAAGCSGKGAGPRPFVLSGNTNPAGWHLASQLQGAVEKALCQGRLSFWAIPIQRGGILQARCRVQWKRRCAKAGCPSGQYQSSGVASCKPAAGCNSP
eukprot:358767-Chlamydomonas_euryale.AAC.4